MSDPATPVLAVVIVDESKGTRKLSFFNVETGESFELPLPETVGGYFWEDSAHFDILSKDLRTLYQMDMYTGQVVTRTLSPQETRLLPKDFKGALRWIPDPSDSAGMILSPAAHDNQARNSRFTAQWIENDQGSTLEVAEAETGNVVWESTAVKNVWGADFAWSPSSVSTLAYVQGKPEPADGFITEDMRLTIVDVSKGQVLLSLSGNFGEIQWSPDGKKILYLDPWFRYRTYGYELTDAPCILNVQTRASTCLSKIPGFVPSGYTLATTGVYSWSSDGRSLYYTYLYRSSDGQMLGNLCVYGLANGDIHCPTQGLEALKGWSILSYELSPDGQFILFCYSAASILNDYVDTANDGVIRMDGTGFFSWVGRVTEDGMPFCSSVALWRPTP